jgi:hypothetical protein
LAVNPTALHDKTADGDTLLSLATSTATKSHPNYALIDELHRQLSFARVSVNPPSPPFPATSASPNCIPTGSSNNMRMMLMMETVGRSSTLGDLPHVISVPVAISPGDRDQSMATPVSSSDPSETHSRGRLDSNDSNKSWQSANHVRCPLLPPAVATSSSRYFHNQNTNHYTTTRKKRRKSCSSSSLVAAARGEQDYHLEASSSSLSHPPPPPSPSLAPFDDPVGLLLHFSRNGSYTQSYNWDDSSVTPMNIAKV